MLRCGTTINITIPGCTTANHNGTSGDICCFAIFTEYVNKKKIRKIVVMQIVRYVLTRGCSTFGERIAWDCEVTSEGAATLQRKYYSGLIRPEQDRETKRVKYYASRNVRFQQSRLTFICSMFASKLPVKFNYKHLFSTSFNFTVYSLLLKPSCVWNPKIFRHKDSGQHLPVANKTVYALLHIVAQFALIRQVFNVRCCDDSSKHLIMQLINVSWPSLFFFHCRHNGHSWEHQELDLSTGGRLQQQPDTKVTEQCILLQRFNV